MDKHDSPEMRESGHAPTRVGREIDELVDELAGLRHELEVRIDALAERLRTIGASLAEVSLNESEEASADPAGAETPFELDGVADPVVEPAVVSEAASQPVVLDEEIDWQALEAEGMLSFAGSSDAVPSQGVPSSTPDGADDRVPGPTGDDLVEVIGSSPGPDEPVLSAPVSGESESASTVAHEAEATRADSTPDGGVDLDAILREEFAAYPAPSIQVGPDGEDVHSAPPAETPLAGSPVDDGGDDFFARPSE